MMPRPRRRRRSALPLFLLCLALGYLIYFEIGSPPTVLQAGPAEIPPPEQVAALPDQPGFAMPPIESFSETVARPLFMATRRPPEPEEVEVEAEPTAGAQRNMFNLLGIVISSDERVALVTRRRGGDFLRLVVGQRVDGWLVVAIEPDSMTLSQGDETEMLKLTDVARPKRRKKRTIQQPEPVEAEPESDDDDEPLSDETQ